MGKGKKKEKKSSDVDNSIIIISVACTLDIFDPVFRLSPRGNTGWSIPSRIPKPAGLVLFSFPLVPLSKKTQMTLKYIALHDEHGQRCDTQDAGDARLDGTGHGRLGLRGAAAAARGAAATAAAAASAVRAAARARGRRGRRRVGARAAAAAGPAAAADGAAEGRGRGAGAGGRLGQRAVGLQCVLARRVDYAIHAALAVLALRAVEDQRVCAADLDGEGLGLHGARKVSSSAVLCV